uniref:C2H2-type domain-containing protein n=1 Tax=Setaria digitata TaxID=48799 RepID=A0A915PIQ1_9BILA
MMPSSLGGGSGSAKHHQQLMQSASMLPSPYSFLPSVFANAQLDMPLFRPPESSLGAMYLSQLAAAAAMSQGQNGTDASNTNEQQEEAVGENNKTEMAASTSSDVATSSYGAESPSSPKPFGTLEREMELPDEQNSADDNVALSPTKVSTDDIVMAENENLQPSSASDLQQLDLSKWISDFFPGLPNNVSALNMAALTQRMPSMLEQMQFMNQYFSPGSVEDSLRVLAALGSTNGSAGTVPSTNCSPGSILNSPFASSAGHSKDTYCEICDKNFCNRYFLRTHKWKKHGIPFPGKNSPSECNVTSLASPTTSQNLPLDLPTTSSGMNLSPAEFIAALCNQNVLEASQISPKTTPSQPTSVIVNCLSNAADSSPTKRARTTDEGSKEDDDSLNAPRSESVRVDEEALANVASQLPNTGDLFAMIARQAQENAIAQELLSSLKAEGIQVQQQSSPSKQHSSNSKEACEMCGQECESRATLQHHLLLQHNILNSFLSSFNLLSPLGQLQPQQQSQKQQNNQSNDADRTRSSTVVPGVVTSPISVSRQPKKQYTTTGKNYCDVCNKEVCNKYFLRTHMLKMHGIVIDEHKTIIANIDTLEKEKSGTIAFRCDICNTNVGQTRESLKHHKQEVHNVVSLPTSRGHRGSLSSTSSITSTSTLSQALRTTDQSGNLNEKEIPIFRSDYSFELFFATAIACALPYLLKRYSARFLEDLKIAFERAFALQTNLVGQLRCPLCDIRTVGVVAMQKHLSEKHKMDMGLESLESFLKDAYEIKTGQSAATLGGSLAVNLHQQMTTERNEFTCTHCGDIFSDQIQFQLHMIHNHPMVIRSPEETGCATVTAHNVEPLCKRYSFQSSSIADSWAESEIKPENRSIEDAEESEVLEAKRNDQHQVAPQKVRKLFDCPISWCSRQYRDPVILGKHVRIVHQWRLKFSSKNGKDKSHGVIAPRKLWKKRYICLFEGCKYRFWSRDDCKRHLSCHIGNETNKTGSKEVVENGTTENGRRQDLIKLVGMREGKVMLRVENGDNRTDQEHGCALGSPDLDVMPEGHGQLSGNKKPYTVQTFLIREQTSQSSSSTNGAASSTSVVFDEMVAHLPVRNTVQEMVRVNVELVPASLQVSPILHL